MAGFPASVDGVGGFCPNKPPTGDAGNSGGVAVEPSTFAVGVVAVGGFCPSKPPEANAGKSGEGAATVIPSGLGAGEPGFEVIGALNTVGGFETTEDGAASTSLGLGELTAGVPKTEVGGVEAGAKVKGAGLGIAGLGPNMDESGGVFGRDLVCSPSAGEGGLEEGFEGGGD